MKCYAPECIIRRLFEEAQNYFALLSVDYHTFKIPVKNEIEFTVYKITFVWNEMYNVTKTGDVTELTYMFGFPDVGMGWDGFQLFSENVDIIWFCYWNPPIESFKFIDFEKVVVASFGGGWEPYRLPKEVQNWRNFYFTGHLCYARGYVRDLAHVRVR